MGGTTAIQKCPFQFGQQKALKVKRKMDSSASGSDHNRERTPMSRPGFGVKGNKISLCTNHFRVELADSAGYFFHYSVSIYNKDGRPAEGKGIGRTIMDKIREIYKFDLDGKDFAYDGEKSLFMWGALPRKELDFTVVLDKISLKSSFNGSGSLTQGGGKRQKCVFQTRTFRVVMKYVGKYPFSVISDMLRGRHSEKVHEVIKVLDVVLRQHAAKKSCLIVKQSFYHDDPKNFTDIGKGVFGCKGLHSSFCPTQNGLTLNMDMSLTTVLKPGPVLDFLVANQNVKNTSCIDWSKARRVLKNLKIKIFPSNRESRITGLSEYICKKQRFLLRNRGLKNDNQEVQVTVYDYFVKHKKMHLQYSGDFPCINIGKTKSKFYPIELCSLLPLQRYTKELSLPQRLMLIESSRQRPLEKMTMLTEARKTNKYATETMLQSCGVSIASTFTQVEGRVLAAPKLIVGRGEEVVPRAGCWNLNGKMLAEPMSVHSWAVVSFRSSFDPSMVCTYFAKSGEMMGISVKPPICIIEENKSYRQAPPAIRVEKILEQLDLKLKPLKAQSNKKKTLPDFILCLLPNKNSDIYGPWKRKTLIELGISNQCISSSKLDMQYFTSLLLKINAKLGGLHSRLAIEWNSPVLSKKPTIIFGMDVCHGSTGLHDFPSIASVVSSRCWPSMSHYRASVRSQSSKAEIIESLFKPMPGNGDKDEGMIRELLLDFFSTSGKVKPSHVIIFRDGVSEGQFKQVLNVEFHQILEACKLLDSDWHPKFTIIIAQKRHHTKFFQSRQQHQNVPPGTVVDSKICHPHYYDFYMCPHAAYAGTARPIHYHVLLDEIGISSDELQELVHSLSYVYQKCTKAISIVTPIRYAHLAASKASQILTSEVFSNHTEAQAPELPKLHKEVCESMFFC
ncbi:protein argonaute 4-like isoform X2 [Chenopodium quinoa]|uniref:protein argonaute 4-like isoform X2 n=1 Tax=Chenopodium quinoa TaxID=63459 RepID=UPI000B76EC93|nr:protein argonaute 4-like isoform X2 [Chenopodium quinoa]